MAGTCKLDGCEKPLGTSGYCYAHYNRIKRNGHPGSPEVKEKNPGAICSVGSCKTRAQARGLCDLHYRRSLKGQDLSTPPPYRHKPGQTCSVDGCERIARTKGYCQGHYGRVKRLGEPGPPLKERREPQVDYAGRDWYVISASVDAQGYVQARLKQHDGKRVQIAVHRIVMQDYLGRDLLPHENVHHINGLRDDNRLENLELWSSSQPSGQRVRDKIAWAREILETYANWRENEFEVSVSGMVEI